MRAQQILLVALLAGGCEDELSRNTNRSADRVNTASDHLRHERRELAVAVAKRADDVAVDPQRAARHIDDVSSQVVDVNQKAAELAEAQQDFAYMKSLRVQSLRAAHSVAASQPLLIQAISSAQIPALLPNARARLDESLVIFRQRLAHTQHEIEELQFVPASEWRDRDDQVTQDMAGLSIARDASWQALEGKTDDKHPFPAT